MEKRMEATLFGNCEGATMGIHLAGVGRIKRRIRYQIKSNENLDCIGGLRVHRV